MKTPSVPLLGRALAWLSFILWMLVGAVPSARAQFNLFPKTPQPDNQFGNAVAMSDRFILVGEPGNDDLGSNAGAAHLFNARTGRYLRKLTAPDTAAGDGFGWSVALSGNLALIGAPQPDYLAGKAYVFDTRNGKLIRQLDNPAAVIWSRFGWSVALSGEFALVGAPGANGKGMAWLFDARSGSVLTSLIGDDTAAGDDFGHSVALNGEFALVGAPKGDDAGNDSGAAYFFHARIASSTQLNKLTATDAAAGDEFGTSVALSGHHALIGAPKNDNERGMDAGAAYVFDARTGQQRRKISDDSGMAGDQFGSSVAMGDGFTVVGAPFHDTSAPHIPDAGAVVVSGILGGRQDRYSGYHKTGFSVAAHGSHALAGAPGNSTNGPDSGSAYRFGPHFQPLGLSQVAIKGQLAPEATNAYFKAFSSAYINPDGEVIFQATLSGLGAINSNRGVWSDLPGDLRLVVRFWDEVNSSWPYNKATKFLGTWSNHPNFALIHTEMNGFGSNQTLLSYPYCYGSYIGRQEITRTGGFVSGQTIKNFVQIAQSGRDYIALNVRFPKAGGAFSNDSAIAFFNHGGGPVGQVFREGDSFNDFYDLGQISTRVAASREADKVGFPAMVFPVGSPIANQALFSLPYAGPASMDFMIALQHGSAPGTAFIGAMYRTFFAESMSCDGDMIYRASFRGEGVTARSNEGLWHENGRHLIARKGQEAKVDWVYQPGIKIARFLGFWPAAGMQAVLLVKLSGPGVNSANDLALLLWDRDMPGDLQVLLREGQFVEGADAPRVRVIQRVDVAPENGHYVALCSLTGASSRNQALFTGVTSFGDSSSLKSLRLPGMVLRKGSWRGWSKMSLPPTLDKTGAGGKGLGQIINQNGEVVLSAELLDKKYRVLSGVP